jgi:hypothetical protein
MDYPLAFALQRNVGLDEMDLCACRRQFLRKLLGRLSAGIVMYTDLRSLLGEGARKGRADTGGGACDQHGLAGQIRDTNGCK